MAKESGLGMTISVDDSGGTARAIGNDNMSVVFATPRGIQDVTGINKSAFERILLLADMTVTITGVFNDAANLSHDVFKTVPSTSVNRTTTIVHSGQTLAGELLYSDYSFNRAPTGELTFTAPGSLADGTTPVWA